MTEGGLTTDFMTSGEVAARLGVLPRQVQKLVHMGRIPSVRHGRCFRIPRAAYEQWLAEQAAAALAAVREASARV